MGTRNLTVVKINNEIKVAQYGQWDGYPEGQGRTVLKFLKDKDLVEKLKQNISRCSFFDDKTEFVIEYNKNCPTWESKIDKRTLEQKRWFETYVSRDIASDILEAIANSKDEIILLKNEIYYETDCGCEYCYKIDFDNNTLEVYDHHDLAKNYDINNLPEYETFISDLTKDDDED